jgi:hypothetical protein
MKIDIPYYSQYSDNIKKDWQDRSCAIVCLQMVLDFYKKESKPMDLIKEGLSISENLEKKGRRTEGYTREFGWGHELLIILLKNNGVLSYRQDFKNPNFESEYIVLGLEKIRQNILDKKPVIVSIAKDINNPKTSGHMVVVSGIEEDNGEVKSFYINDPEKEENKNTSIEDFKKVWKKLAIFVN